MKAIEMTPNKQFKIWLLLLSLFTMSAIAMSCGGSKANVRVNASASPSPAAIDVTTASAIQRELPRYFEATGSLAGDMQSDVQPQTSGKVVALGVDLGSYVKRGQMIVKLESEDSKLRLDQAIAQLESAKAATRQAEEKIGVRPNQPFDPERVPEVAAARANYELAEKNLQRAVKLIESGDVSRASFDQQKAQRDALKETYQAALAQARQNFAAVAVARSNVANAQSQVDLARRALAYTVITSPIDGFVAERPVDLGEYVTTTTKVATVVRTDPLRVRIDIPEQAIPQVKTGESVSVTTSAWPDRSFSGRIARISPNVTPNSRTLTVEAEIENGSGALKPGQFATVRILLPRTEPAVLVPARAVKTEAGVSRVFVIKDGHAQQRLVQLGQTEGDLVEIKQGVAADEIVATSNTELLSDGITVKQ
ncbi:MAG TPA: efflux RND transporter periplasmic adaptor subunit [Pyrinomonadaceae bacterium]|nr:efflux RND transporter periplasmic adaptor subunit [Pyrinomonadaceae bacterium]